jgi:UDP-2,3-diacylglucosamine pyrophosphatase LpxH
MWIFLFYLVRAEKLIYNNIICYLFNSNDHYNYYFYGNRDFFLKKISTKKIKKINLSMINIIIGEIMQT